MTGGVMRRPDAGPPGSPGAPGEPGTPGVRGSFWTAGSGAPSASANIGDMYLNTANGDVYQRGSLGWQSMGNIRGAAGSPGSTGPAGPNFSITEVTGATSSAINNRYIANHATVRVVITLPAVAAIGDFIQVFGKGVAGWRVSQNANQQIRGATNSTVGTGGYIQSGSQNDTVTLVCTTANTMWAVQNQRGSPSIA